MLDKELLNVASISPKLVKVIIDQEMDKLKITSGIANCVEDLADQAGQYGRGVAKLNIQNQSSSVRNEWLPTLSKIIDDFFKLTITITSKQYTSFSANLVNSVSKPFPEYVKGAKKTIQSHFSKVVALQEDLRKSKANFTKLSEKYCKLVRETEIALNLRPSSTLMEPKLPDGDVQLKEEGFSNLSFSRMLSKIAPGEKKPNEKSREMIRDIEQLEQQLQIDVRRINVIRSEMLLEISKLYKTIESVEMERLKTMNEGATRFILALDVVIEKHLDSFFSLRGSSETYDSQVELSTMFNKLAPNDSVNQPAYLANLDIDHDKMLMITSIHGLSLKVDSLVDLIDHFHGLTHKLSSTISELLDVDQCFLRGTKKQLEKHGFCAIPSPEALYDLVNSSQSAAWLMKNYEADNTRKAWELIICLIGLVEDLKIKDYDMYSDEISHQLDLIEKRLMFDRKELISVQSSNMRKIEQCSVQYSKCRVKLSKVRQQLKERRGFLRSVKGSTADLDKSFDEIPADQDPTANEDDVETPSTIMRRSSVKQTLEKANSTLKQVVGFESTADRLTRIGNQITAYEEEEAQLIELEKQTNELLIASVATGESEIKTCINLIQDYLYVDIESLKSLLFTYFKWQTEKYESLKVGSSNSKIIDEKDNLMKQDLASFCGVLCSISEGDFESSTFDILSSDTFDAIKSDVILEEKKLLGIAVNPPRNEAVSTENESIETRGIALQDNVVVESSGNDLDANCRDESSEEFGTSQHLITESNEDKSLVKPLDENLQGQDDLRALASPQPPRIDSPTKISADFELKKFGLSNQDKVLISYSCALYPRKGLLTHGRLFITQHYLAFSGWPETRVLLSMIDVMSVEKTNTLGYIPNAITVKLEDKSEYFFGSFMDRDQCHSLIKNLLEVEKRITELHGADDAVVNRQLEFGYQTKSFFNKPKISDNNGDKSDLLQKPTDDNFADVVTPEDADNEDDLITEVFDFTFNSFLSSGALVSLGQHQFACRSRDIWSKCWLESSDYSDLLFKSGDLDIKGNDWEVLSHEVPEDVTKMAFSFKREFNFAHPRTTMLMFGPKNAPAKQCHYAYIPSKIARSSKNMDELRLCKPKKFGILFITQFDGIPMADVFKVLQYWSFEDNGKGCAAKVALAIHYVKPSMFKGQILSGSKDEITSQVASWFKYAEAATKLSSLGMEQIDQLNSAKVVDSVPTVEVPSTVEKQDIQTAGQKHNIIEVVLIFLTILLLVLNIFLWFEMRSLWKEVNYLKSKTSP